MGTHCQFVLPLIWCAVLVGAINEGLRDSTHYPSDALSDSSIKGGGAVFYFFGLFYVLLCIMQIYRVYLTPCMRCMKKSSCLSAETVDGVLEPITEAATECFVFMFSTSLGVTDIGISTILGSSSYLAYIDRGVAILIAGALGKIDWLVGCRDILLFSIVLFAMGMVLIPGYIAPWSGLIMLVVFVLLLVFSFFSKSVEGWAREVYSSRVQGKSQMRLPRSEIAKLHAVKNSELTYSPRSLLSEEYRLSNGYIFYLHKNVERTRRFAQTNREDADQTGRGGI